MSRITKTPAPAGRRKRAPSIDELNKIVATNHALTEGDEVAVILGEQGIDASDPKVRQRLRRARRNIRRLNKRLKKGRF